MAKPAVILIGAVAVGTLVWWLTKDTNPDGVPPQLGTILNTLPAGSVFVGNDGDGDQYRDTFGYIWLERFDGRWERIA